MRRYHEQLSEEHAWYTAAEGRVTTMSRTELEMSHVTSLSEEVNLHLANILDLRDNVTKLGLDQVEPSKLEVM